MTVRLVRLPVLFLGLLLLASCGLMRGPEPATPSPTPETGAEEEPEEETDDYADALPDDAVARTGLFTAHLTPGGEIFFEIPEEELGLEMLLVVGRVERPGNSGTAGFGRVIQWDRRNDHITVRLKNYDQIADSTDAIWSAVSGMRNGPIMGTFEIEGFAPDGGALIDVTSLFTESRAELGSLSNVDDDMSWVEHVAAFPRNIEVDVTQTSRQNGETTTEVLHWSFVKLPDEPMMPRIADDRVGFISSDYIDYSSSLHGSDEVEVIHRHRLEKADPNAEMSDPVEPIVYWVDPATPDWLKPYVVAGVDDWQPAFEAAGFTNAIEGRVAPTREEDPDFSMDDARHSAIYWRPSTTANANGGQVVDPRTGEIIRGRVQMFHNVQDLVQDWYFTQVGPLDPRAQELPLPDSLMGELVRYVVAHEIGHAIGYPHNMKASAMYPADSLRSAAFLERMGGHVATLMDYSRFNYVAQPEDDIPVELLIPGVGPYDEFAVRWGYSPIPEASTPEEEREILDEWARMQDTIPWYRFTTSGAPDPYAMTEAVGDRDAVQSSELGLRNLQRVMDMLIPVAEKPGESYELLDDLYGNVIGQWGRYNGHVAAIVGGAYAQERYGTGTRFRSVEFERQREAVRFLADNVFHAPDWVLDREILRRIEAEGAVDRIRTQQVRVLGSLMNQSRLERLIEYESLANGEQRYTLADLMEDVRDGVWTEFQGGGQVAVDVYRRNLQRAHVDMLRDRLDPPPPAEGGAPERVLSDVRPVLRGELRWIRDALADALPRATDTITRLHIEDLQAEVSDLLEGE